LEKADAHAFSFWLNIQQIGNFREVDVQVIMDIDLNRSSVAIYNCNLLMQSCSGVSGEMICSFLETAESAFFAGFHSENLLTHEADKTAKYTDYKITTSYPLKKWGKSKIKRFTFQNPHVKIFRNE